MSAGAFTKIKSFVDTIRWGQRSKGYMEEIINLQVHIAYDDEAQVWYIAKSDIPGLSLEAESATKLVDRIVEAGPELYELNKGVRIDYVQTHVNEPRRVDTASRPRLNLLPIFDSPMQLVGAH